MQDKDPKKLTAEELEKRVAPAALVVDTSGTGGGEGSTSGKAPGKDAK